MASIASISNLPDSLLLHIMSFLDSQKAVQTCVLSKRWKNLWASLQCLHLDQSKLKITTELKGERFTYYVNTLLLLRDTSDLQKFHLRCSYNDDSIMSWILYAIKCNAKVIKIKIDVMDYKRLPQFMFNSASLEELNLCIYNIDKGIGFRAINLPRLKKLKLRVRSDDSDINKLTLGCPALEDLYLIDCIMNIRVVSFPKLKYLKIRSWKEDMFIESIGAPNLVSLVLVGLAQPYGEISFEKMPSLMNTTISLWSRSCYSLDAEKCNLLRAVANVQKLDLSGKIIIQALFQIELPRCPTFFNLTTMLLRYFCLICHSNEVGDILKHTPNLKKLTLCKNNDDKHECDMEANQGRSNSVKNALFQCKNLDEIEVELKFINVGTKQLVNTLVESLAELKTTHLILSFHRIDYTSPSPARLHRFCLSMIQGKHVLTLLRGNKFIVWSK